MKRLVSKEIIKQATRMSNLSQWIQVEIWTYIQNTNSVKFERNAVDLAGRIIERVLEDKNLVDNYHTTYKEGFDAGYKKGRKDLNQTK